MKKGIVYILLIAQATLLLKPVMPYISDGVAHVFWYSKHMATVHYVNGKFHVHKDVIADQKRNGDKNPYSIKNGQTQSEYLISQPIQALAHKNARIAYFAYAIPPFLSLDTNGDFPPPKC